MEQQQHNYMSEWNSFPSLISLKQNVKIKHTEGQSQPSFSKLTIHIDIHAIYKHAIYITYIKCKIRIAFK